MSTMSMGPLVDQPPPEPEEPTGRRRVPRAVWYGVSAVLLLAVTREISGADDLTSSGTFSAALRLAVPIGLAALGGLWAERCGVVNIGLEGMMILGTWFGAYGGVELGPWWGVVFGIVGGGLGGLVHAIATVRFGVDHVVSGVAINILGAGAARYLSVVFFVPMQGGGANQSPRVGGGIPDIDLPLLAGGFGTPDVLGRIARWRWFVVSDVAAALRALTGNLSVLTILTLFLVLASAWVLWKTAFGLRLRSAGEHPPAAESLGVDVMRMKYIGVVVSGMFAGLAGAFLVLELAGIYREGQTGGRGFIALAALVFGNWRPVGLAAGAALFGFADALQLRSGEAVHALLLFIALAALAGVVWMLVRRKVLPATLLGVTGVAFVVWYLGSEVVPPQFVYFTPHLTTLLVLAFATQRLRMPAYDGVPYRKGEGV
jgi:ABC-type uncharacterized transport system permease subunit